jgi:hypothetical protein
MLLGVVFDVEFESGVKFIIRPLIIAQIYRNSQKHRFYKKFKPFFLPVGLGTARNGGPGGGSPRIAPA